MTTEDNLLEALAGESEANRRYLAYAKKADEEGYPEAASLFRAAAAGETAHALGHLERLDEVGSTRENLQAAIEGETMETEEIYPTFAKEAREEDREDIAEWFEYVARAEQRHAERFQEALDKL